MQRLPGGACGRCSGRRASPSSGRPSCPPHRPLPVLVHQWCPPGSVPVRCPAIRCPAVRCPAVRCPVTWLRRPGPTCPAIWCRRPAVSCLVSARRSYGVCPVPGSDRRGPWEHAGPHGHRGWSGPGSGWPAGCPSGAVDGCGGLDAGHACGGRGSTAGSVPLAGRGPGPVAFGPRRWPRGAADRLGRPAWPGPAHRRRLPWARDVRLLSVVVVEPDARVDWPQGAMAWRHRMAVRPQRGPARR
jgi:hypothetical protein